MSPADPHSPGTGRQRLAVATTVPGPNAAAATAAAGAADPSLQRRVFGLAWPVISENFLQTMLGIVDTLLVAQLGTAAIAGVGSALQVMFFVVAALSAMSVGSSVLVAQAVGGRRYDHANLYAKQSVVWSLLLSIPMVIAGLALAGPVLAVFGMAPDVTAIGTDYLRVTMGTVVVLTLLLLGGGVLRGAGDSRTPMIITMIINVINVVLTYALIFGTWGLPALGAVGSAWATFIARALGCVMILMVLWRGRHGVSIRGRQGWMPSFTTARGILNIGVPAALEQLLITTAFLVLTVIVARLGTAALAAHRIAFNALSISFLPGIGFGIATTALVGQAVGAHRMGEAAAVARIATIWAMLWMGAIALLILFFAEPMMRAFSDDPVVVAMGAAGLRVVALAQPLWAILFVQSGALRGAGNTRFPLRVNATGIWSAVLLSAALLATVGGGLVSVWVSFLFTAPFTCGLMWWRFRRIVSEGVTPVAADVVAADAIPANAD